MYDFINKSILFSLKRCNFAVEFGKTMTKVVKIVAGVGALVAAVVAYGAYQLFSSPFGVTETVRVYVDADDSIDSVRTKLESAGMAKSMTGFDMMRQLKRFEKPRTGCYEIVPGENMFNCVRKFANGQQSPVRLIVPEVRTVDDMAERLAAQLMLGEDELRETIADADFIGGMGYSEETLPCMFVPNTYEIYWNVSAKNLLERMDRERKAFWNDERKKKADELGMTMEEVTTLASIVESETSYGPEKPTVAGLYAHRLEIGMPLQSDPTVIFAVGDFTIRRVLSEHLKIDSPYNTYRYAGLPPGPIRIASIQGIDAVLNHDHNQYLYMCAKEDFSGSHNFTSSYAEHMQNARRYQTALNQRGIRK